MEEDTECAAADWQLPLAFSKSRHSEVIEGATAITQTWRMKERMKTVSVALVLCLNVGVDPPDIVKTQPCARLECWIDPSSFSPAKALETIGANMQKQYERWQPRARYKQSLDPTAEEVKKLCTSLRRNAKEERVLFHYNGHGVPKPTANGEIWVFNKSYTQYIPLSVYDLQTWMGAPSIYVYDCSNAGIIVDSFKGFAEQHEREYEVSGTRGSGSAPCFKNCIQLAACSASQILPMNPDLPADIFTSCLTTPMKIAIRWFVLQNSARLVPKVNLDLIDKIPGQLNDRRTMLGELNWIFTAITDTIAWNTLPRDLFQKLFRQDLLVASLFRNFLLAERILRSYDCTPVSSPRLPHTHQHPMWHAWDLALDLCLAQLPGVLEQDRPFQHSAFFQEQLTAFQVWLHLGSEIRAPPEQLPVVLQVLLSQVHRLRALELLGRFLDLGPWAVNLALSVGIFPYVLKLLQSSARELRPLLVFIWAKILAVDSTCQADLVRDNGHKYFLSVLQDLSMPSEHRTLAAFVLASVVNNYPQGQEVALQGSLVSICLVQLSDPSPLLRQWLAICLGRLWTNYAPARWCGVRDIAHEKLYNLLSDPVPEVRTAAVYALGTFISSVVERSEHANTIDHSVAMKLLNTTMYDMSPLVRKELIIALQAMVNLFEKSFISVALQESGQVKDGSAMMLVSVATDVLLSPAAGLKRIPSRDRLKMLSPTPVLLDGGSGEGNNERIKRVSSSSSLYSMGPGSMANLPSAAFGSIYQKLWAGLTALEQDPYPGANQMAKLVIEYVREQVNSVRHKEVGETRISSSVSLPPSPSSRPTFLTGESPPTSGSTTDLHRIASRPTYSFGRPRKTVPNTISEESDECSWTRKLHINTNFVEWSCKYFAQPIMRLIEDTDAESDKFYEREWRYLRNANMRAEAKEEQRKLPLPRIEEKVFSLRFNNVPNVLLFQPYEPIIVIAGKDSVGLWDYYTNTRLAFLPNTSIKGTKTPVKITALDLINPHDVSLLLVGADDGSIRLWNHQSALHGVASSTGGLSLVSAWQALAEAQPTARALNGVSEHGGRSSSGLVVSWEQQTLNMVVSGDVRVVRLWDANQELRVRDIPTECDSCVTSLSSDGQLIVAGCGDGSIRVFDRRLSQSDARVLTWREHNAWVVNCALRNNTIISGSVMGDVRFFDLRQNSSPSVIHTSQEMTAMAIHKQANVFSCGSLNQLSMYTLKGHHINTIKHHEGFLAGRIEPVSCLAFHPQRAGLATGSVDASVSIYSVDSKR
ncbi:regulatory-associated protein of mTOR isoform X3 [Frankliniella occidentalis]|uniref:Regulatory-associated protein of mTOR isoform X3 n=1 Tax=Frankliniella occidentalis TaxID=133901 RepID=A0A6J1T3X5_FRAOC|nr:regulatory-associated protein of mTOR isoform X3 [Frankliniella occidentalis]